MIHDQISQTSAIPETNRRPEKMPFWREAIFNPYFPGGYAAVSLRDLVSESKSFSGNFQLQKISFSKKASQHLLKSHLLVIFWIDIDMSESFTFDLLPPNNWGIGLWYLVGSHGSLSTGTHPLFLMATRPHLLVLVYWHLYNHEHGNLQWERGHWCAALANLQVLCSSAFNDENHQDGRGDMGIRACLKIGHTHAQPLLEMANHFGTNLLEIFLVSKSPDVSVSNLTWILFPGGFLRSPIQDTHAGNLDKSSCIHVYKTASFMPYIYRLSCPN